MVGRLEKGDQTICAVANVSRAGMWTPKVAYHSSITPVAIGVNLQFTISWCRKTQAADILNIISIPANTPSNNVQPANNSQQLLFASPHGSHKPSSCKQKPTINQPISKQIQKPNGSKSKKIFKKKVCRDKYMYIKKSKSRPPTQIASDAASHKR